jgi:murein DD-endopeptidase MepM/ murein hydrolase activator NlpD
VTFADYATNGYGMHVVVDHGFDYETLYAHLSELEGAQWPKGEAR